MNLCGDLLWPSLIPSSGSGDIFDFIIDEDWTANISVRIQLSCQVPILRAHDTPDGSSSEGTL